MSNSPVLDDPMALDPPLNPGELLREEQWGCINLVIDSPTNCPFVQALDSDNTSFGCMFPGAIDHLEDLPGRHGHYCGRPGPIPISDLGRCSFLGEAERFKQQLCSPDREVWREAERGDYVVPVREGRLVWGEAQYLPPEG